MSRKQPSTDTSDDYQQAVAMLMPVLFAARALDTNLAAEEQSARAKAWVYLCLRRFFSVDALLKELLRKPLRKREMVVATLLHIGLSRLIEGGDPVYSVVNETVAAAKRAEKGWASGLINAVLRNFLRERDLLLHKQHQHEHLRFDHPQWMVSEFAADWPDNWQQILTHNLVQPPMWLRVNRSRTTRDQYMQQLARQGIDAHAHDGLPQAVRLEQPVAVARLPGFPQGQVSVQDGAAQYAGSLLAPQASHRVLDACAAPGGKSGHLAELVPTAPLTALEISAQRAMLIDQNRKRLGLDFEIVVADAGDLQAWWDGVPFDRILLDAPCSASGVIRRHPDIRLLRRRSDLQQLAAVQLNLLSALWQTLAAGGRLLYVTCSLFRAENDEVVGRFLQQRGDSNVIGLPEEFGCKTRFGRQNLPGEDDMDGFYFSLLEKTETEAR